jgi:hypothetical protein
VIQDIQIAYAKSSADGALPDLAGTFTVVHTPFDAEAIDLKVGEVPADCLESGRRSPRSPARGYDA